MVDPTPSDYHLTYLRERWERDRSSRIFLQLAEEYRRRGLHAEALEVLQVGLSHHPGYLAAQVSLGRCRLEADQPEAAAEVLTGVLSHDPTQAVASRLLIETWLKLRDAERARAAIDRCKLLGVPPQELHGYESRLSELRAQQDSLVAAAPARPAADEVSLSTLVEAAAGRSVADSGAAEAPLLPPPPVAPPRAEPVAAAPFAAVEESAPAEVSAPPPAPPAPAPSPSVPDTIPSPPPSAASWKPAAPIPSPPGEVFHLPPVSPPPLALPPRPAARRLLRAAAGDPFALAAPTLLAAATGQVFALHEGLVAAPKEASVPEPQGPAPPPPLAFVPRQAAPEEAPRQIEPPPPLPPAPPAPATQEFAEPPAEPVREEPKATAGGAPEAAPWWRASGEAPPAAPATVSAAPPAPAMTQPTPAVPPPAAGTSRPPLVGAIGVELQPSGALPAPELRPSDPGTATLGELYLRQGHLGEARKIFHQVLERDPDNEVALRGLEAIGRRRGTSLSAAELVGGDEPDVRGVTSRKILLLERYLEQLRAGERDRRGAGSDVPGATE